MTMNGELREHMTNRLEEIRREKAGGRKVVGYLPGNYVPEELIYASGAIPLCLGEGGDPAALAASVDLIPRNFCSFVRAQVGERRLQRNPYYGLVDMLVAPVACQHLKKAAEIWEYQDASGVFKLGVPLHNSGAPDLEYFVDRLRELKRRLEALTGNEISDERLRESIGLYNKLREAFREVSLLRREPGASLNTLDFIKLNHASFYADPVVMLRALESIREELVGRPPVDRAGAPRLLLIGPNVAREDYGVLEMVEAAGGDIVVEQIDEGVRNYWDTIAAEGDPIEALGKGYLADRVPCAFMIDSAKKRLDFALDLIADFHVSGAIWYELLGCETYDSEGYFFASQLEERGIPVLVLEADYGTTETGPARNRVDAFVEMVKEY